MIDKKIVEEEKKRTYMPGQQEKSNLLNWTNTQNFPQIFVRLFYTNLAIVVIFDI